MKDKKIKKYIIFIVILLAGLIFIEMNKKEPVSWSPTFVNTDKNPYGIYICYNLLKDVFPQSDIYESRQPVTNELYYIDEDGYEYSNDAETEAILYQNTSYIFIIQKLGARMSFFGQYEGMDIDKLDIKNLLRFVENGNNVFIAAEEISPLLSDTLQINIKTKWSGESDAYVFTDLNNKKEYSLEGVRDAKTYIEKKDSCKLYTRTLARSKDGERDIFVKIKFGKGYIYLHSMPTAFSNVELLKTDQYDFAFSCLSYLPKTDNIIWDEYLKQGRVGEYSSFRVIWNHPALLIGFYVVIFGLLLFVLFKSKRTQRIIPVVKPPRNTSLEFLDTISNLYYQKQAYGSIAEKRQSYFLDTVRTHYYLRTETIDDEFISTLSMKSGVTEEAIERIFRLYKEIQNSYYVNNTLLIKYSEALEKFYRYMK